MLSIAVFHGDVALVAKIRQLPGKEVPRELARLLDALQVRRRERWCVKKGGNVEGEQRVLTDFCHGYFGRGNTDPGRA